MITIGRTMTLEISNNRRSEIKRLVLTILNKYSKPCVPVKIGNIIRNIPNVKLITYSSQIKKYHITYEEMIVDAETRDSYVVCNSTMNRYCIYYNDLDYTIINSNRVRWNLAHELGHIVLGHHKHCKHHKLFRDGFSSSIYNYMEEEANYFAQLILVPHVVLYAFKVSNVMQLKNLCKISNNAARHRFRAYIDWKKNLEENISYDKPLFHFYYNFIYKKNCTTCGASMIQRSGKYCPICGTKTIQWGDGNMIYSKLDTHKNGKLTVCPNCSNEETDIEGDFCQICGENLVNKCSNDDCYYNEPLPSNARFCPICGSSSTFYNSEFLKKWDYKEPVDPFMEIPDGIDEQPPFAIDVELPFN